MNDEKEVTLRIPGQLLEQVQESCHRAGFKNVNEFLLFVLKEIFREDVQEMDRREMEILQQRLEELGYL